MDVPDLQKDHEYKFRVRAVNRQGKSEPLTAQQGVVAKNPFGQPVHTTNQPSTSFFLSLI
jgi:hypothetical protein